MGGFFGTTLRDEDCVTDLFYGVDYNSHLGTRRGGMATVSDSGKIARSIHNIENTYFRTKFEADLSQFSGRAGIGVISDNDAQPIIINSHLGRMAIVTVAKINNIAQLQEECLQKGQHFCEHSNDTVNPTELVATLITEGNTLVEGFENVYNKVKGSCSMLVLLADGSIVAARDKVGRTPIVVGRKTDGSGHAACSESCAFPNLGYEFCYNVGPAEIVRITPDKIEQLKAPGEEMQICAFLWTYYGYAPCKYEGRNVDEMRYDSGMEVGKNDPTEIDLVSPIPDSGTGMALGYAAGKNVPFKRAMVKYTPTWPRSFTPSDQKRRELVAKMKLIPNMDMLRGKRVAFCDDSIVRGTQLRDNVSDLRKAGTKEVHVRISCPPLVYPCEFINFTSSKGMMELITRRVIAKLEGCMPEDVSEYCRTGSEKYNAMVEEIRKELGLDSLQFSPIETVVRAIGLPKCRICTHCFDGSSHD